MSTPPNAGPPQPPQPPSTPPPGQPYQPPADPRFASTYNPSDYDPARGASGTPAPGAGQPAPGDTPGEAQYPATDGPDAAPAEAPGSGTGEQQRPVGFDPKGHVKRGRVSAVWVGLIAAAIFLILLIIFIAQNQKRAAIHFLGFSGHMPVGLTILIAAIVGLLLAAIPGSIRIFQLRRALKINTPKDQRVTEGRGRS